MPSIKVIAFVVLISVFSLNSPASEISRELDATREEEAYDFVKESCQSFDVAASNLSFIFF